MKYIINNKSFKNTGKMAFFVALILCLSALPLFAEKRVSAAKLYVTDLCCAEGGEDAAYMLEKDGYTVVYPAVKVSSQKKIYLGYRTGSNKNKAIRDVIFDNSKSAITIKVNNKKIKYKAVRGVGKFNIVGENFKGKKSVAYLHYTKDKNAGSPISSIYFQNMAKKKNSIIKAGAVPIKKKNGKNVGIVGKGNQKIFLEIVRNDISTGSVISGNYGIMTVVFIILIFLPIVAISIVRKKNNLGNNV